VHVEAGLKAARDPGVTVWGQCIVKWVFTQRAFKHRVRFIERHQIDRPSFTILTPIPGTELLTSFDAVIER
jgi:hopanoid C-3 methylase